MQAADFAAPAAHSTPPAAQPQQTFAARPGKAKRRKQTRQVAADTADQRSSADVSPAGSGSGGTATAADAAGSSGGVTGSVKETAVRALLSAGSMLVSAAICDYSHACNAGCSQERATI